MNKQGLSKGFTLIELLVVIAIIAILAAILFPIFASAKKSGMLCTCMSNQRQIGLAYRNYMQDNNNRFMPGAGYPYYGRCSVDILTSFGYVKSKNIFLCPSAPHTSQYIKSDPLTGQQFSPNAPDCTWKWGGFIGNYGMSLFIGGRDWSFFANGESAPWVVVPFEADVKRQTKVIMMTESRWVDLGGGSTPGRIGMARERHNGGAPVLFCDMHVKWINAKYLNATTVPDDATVYWDPRTP